MKKIANESEMSVPSGSWLRKVVDSVEPKQMAALLDSALELTLDEPKNTPLTPR